jgi:hypothetical protein
MLTPGATVMSKSLARQLATRPIGRAWSRPRPARASVARRVTTRAVTLDGLFMAAGTTATVCDIKTSKKPGRSPER